MGKYQGYEKYKDSGVEWLGKIPEHWKVTRAKFVSDIFVPQRNKPELNLDDGLPWLTMDDMLGDRVSHTKFKVTKEASINAGSKSLKKGSVIASCIGNFGVCTINDVDVIINQQLQAFIPNSHIIPEYLRELVKISSDYFQMIATAATVIYVNQAGFANMPITLPPPDEQEKIARFLDHKTKQIDDLIAKKEALIEKLDEKRTALISHAVTKGLDPNVPMKDSGIEWLDEIPENWKRIPFRWCCYITEGQVDPTQPKFKDLPLIAPNHIESQTGKLVAKETAEDQGAISGKYFYKSGTLLYSKIRPALVKACISDEDGLCSADMYPIKTAGILSNKFMLYQILSKNFTQLAILVSDRVAMPKVNRETLGGFPILVPPLKEQQQIVDYLDEQTASITQQKAKIQQAIELLKEYRTALITNAVTGKIDVRQVPIPEAQKPA
ncbi:restriction endonuclease subunit S [Aliinostoc sp. HNIBRCY26]|uniref:restriction endonuclease subunit S n=1 Tax=Aliinostoc sp. HNIBRCY26 TaxID=3418997 RepID=UPI003D07F21E